MVVPIQNRSKKNMKIRKGTIVGDVQIIEEYIPKEETLVEILTDSYISAEEMEDKITFSKQNQITVEKFQEFKSNIISES